MTPAGLGCSEFTAEFSRIVLGDLSHEGTNKLLSLLHKWLGDPIDAIGGLPRNAVDLSDSYQSPSSSGVNWKSVTIFRDPDFQFFYRDLGEVIQQWVQNPTFWTLISKADSDSELIPVDERTNNVNSGSFCRTARAQIARNAEGGIVAVTVTFRLSIDAAELTDWNGISVIPIYATLDGLDSQVANTPEAKVVVGYVPVVSSELPSSLTWADDNGEESRATTAAERRFLRSWIENQAFKHLVAPLKAFTIKSPGVMMRVGSGSEIKRIFPLLTMTLADSPQARKTCAAADCYACDDFQTATAYDMSVKPVERSGYHINQLVREHLQNGCRVLCDHPELRGVYLFVH